MTIEKDRTEEADEPVIVAQAEIVGAPFNRITDKNLGSVTAQERRVRVVQVLNVDSGLTFYQPIKASPLGFHPEDLEHVTFETPDNDIDLADVASPTLPTILKHGSSTSGIDMDQVDKKRGGDPSFRLPKTGGRKFKEI